MSNLALTKTAKGVVAAIKGLDDPDRAVVISALKVLAQYKDELLSDEDVVQMIRELNNIAKEYRIVMVARKGD